MSETKSAFPLRVRMLVLFLAVGAVIPMLGTTYLLPMYGVAVRTSEERGQQILLSRVREVVGGNATNVRRELRLLAGTMSEASRQEESGFAQALLRAALASSPHVDVVRPTIPEAQVNTVLNKEGADPNSVPEPSQEALDTAGRDGWAYELRDSGKALITVQVPNRDGAKGYVSAVHHVDQLRHTLEGIATRDGISQTSVAVATRDGRIISAYLSEGGSQGDAEEERKVFEQRADSLDLTRQFSVDGREMLGSNGTLPELGWKVAVWRPLDAALEDYHRVRSIAYGAFAVLIALSLVLAFWASESLARPILRIARQARSIGKRKWNDVGDAMRRRDELGELSRAITTMASDLRTGEEEIKLEEQKRATLSRFLSQSVVEDVLSGRNAVALGGHHQDVTVVFADMVAFSRAAEVHPPERVVGVLNELFSVMTEVVFRHGGTVDKFIGDCIMGVWGAPVAQEDHAEKGVRAARDMMRFLEAAAEDWYEKYQIEVRLAVGVHSGSAIVGNIGSEKRMEYTVVGDVVNVAARLESIAAPNQVLIGEETVKGLGAGFATRLLGQRELTGRRKAVTVYELEMA